jgi:Holliday junction DNA helicase RuvA
MISFIDGILEESAPLAAVVNVQGIGYHLAIPLTTTEKLPAIGQRVRLHTHAVYREDSQALYGFATREERDLFRLLTEKVSGIGPKIALSILSRLSPELLRAAIGRGDVALLAKCPGIGRKTAERLCIELRDYLGAGGAGVPVAAAAGSSDGGTPAADSTVADAVAALLALGYKLDFADKAVRQARAKLGAASSTEALIKEALR